MTNESGAGENRSTGDLHYESQLAWEANAAYWDEQMGEGNAFVEQLIWPVTPDLLELQPGQRLLEVATGNGLYARRLAELGAEVVAFDYSAGMIERARRKSDIFGDRITYHVLDAVDDRGLLALGERSFDAAVCHMALFDISTIDPLFQALSRLLQPGGVFLFSLMHPAFNNPFADPFVERRTIDGRMADIYGVKVTGYMTAGGARGEALRDQPRPQIYFHRPLQAVLAPAFAAGFVLDAFLEQSFPADLDRGTDPLGWSGRLSEIPPVCIGRLRLL